MKPSALQRFWQAFDRCLQTPMPAVRLGAFRALVCGVALYDVLLYSPLVLADAGLVTAGGAVRPWTPIYLFQVLGLGPIGSEAARGVQLATIVTLLAGGFGLLSRSSCAVAALGFLYWTGLAYSFGKPHHDKVALAFALGALAFAQVGRAVSVDALLARFYARLRGRGEPLPPPLVSAMPIRLTQFTLAVGYCGAGGAKLLLGGLDWFNGYTLQGIMLGHDGDWSRLFAQSVFWCRVQSIGVVLVQVAFPLVFVWPRLRWFFLPAATGFHLMTWKTMDTGPYMRVWLLLFAFVPLEQVPSTLRRWLAGGGSAAFSVVVVGGAYVSLVASVLLEVVPWWGVAGLLLGLLLSFLRHWRRHLRQPRVE